MQEDAGIRVRHAGVGEKRKYKKQSTADKPILYSMCANNDCSCNDCTVFDKIGGQDGKTIQKGGRQKMQGLESVMQGSGKKGNTKTTISRR